MIQYGNFDKTIAFAKLAESTEKKINQNKTTTSLPKKKKTKPTTKTPQHAFERQNTLLFLNKHSVSEAHFVHIIIYSEEIYLPYFPFLLTLKDIYNTFLLGQIVAQGFIHLKQNQIQDAFFLQRTMTKYMYLTHIPI